MSKYPQEISSQSCLTVFLRKITCFQLSLVLVMAYLKRILLKKTRSVEPVSSRTSISYFVDNLIVLSRAEGNEQPKDDAESHCKIVLIIQLKIYPIN